MRLFKEFTPGSNRIKIEVYINNSIGKEVSYIFIHIKWKQNGFKESTIEWK